MNKMVGLTILAACGFALLSGCGASGNTNKLKSMAVRYVKEKYGFKAKSKRVSNDGISWLTPIWEKSKAGIVEMTHDGKTFYVHADLNSCNVRKRKSRLSTQKDSISIWSGKTY